MAFAVEPGYRLAGRYRLRRPAAGPTTRPSSSGPVLTPVLPGIAHWLGHDEMLNRPVGIRVLAADDPAADAVLDAARRAATLEDPRFLAVLDADRCDGLAYVVTEWVEARDLSELLAAGPLGDLEAQGLAAELARALVVAHAVGLSHGRLLPECVLVTDAGRLKIAGLAVSGAAHRVGARASHLGTGEDGGRSAAEDPSLDPFVSDVRGAGAVLYAALTGRWPLPESFASTSLPPAPVVDGEACTPRQVRAAVPAGLDDTACRALGIHLRRGDAALAGAQDLADLLPTGSGAGESSTGPLPVVPQDAGDVPLLAAPAGPGLARRAAAVAVACVLAGGTGLLGYQVVVGASASAPAVPEPPPSSAPRTSPPTPELTPAGIGLPVREVLAFDPQGDGSEHDDRTPFTIDGDPATAWTTQEYYNDPLGGLKDGVGVVLDLGEARSVGAVTLDLVGDGSDVELRAADGSGPEPPGDLDDYRVVAGVEDASGTITLSPARPAPARWLLVWFTNLPLVGEAEFRGGISELAVRS